MFRAMLLNFEQCLNKTQLVHESELISISPISTMFIIEMMDTHSKEVNTEENGEENGKKTG